MDERQISSEDFCFASPGIRPSPELNIFGPQRKQAIAFTFAAF